MRSNLLLQMVFVLLPAAYVSAAIEPPDNMTFPARPGAVSFSHKKHVQATSNCKTCHDRKGGKIKGLGKEWAHKVCRGCHEAIMMGPVICGECHAGAKK